MEISKRLFLKGLLASTAVGVIPNSAVSLNLQNITEYVPPDCPFVQLDVYYKYMFIRPEWVSNVARSV